MDVLRGYAVPAIFPGAVECFRAEADWRCRDVADPSGSQNEWLELQRLHMVLTTATRDPGMDQSQADDQLVSLWMHTLCVYGNDSLSARSGPGGLAISPEP